MIGHFKICNFFYLAALVGHLWLWQKLLGLFCNDKLNHFTSYGSPKLVMHFYVIILIRKYWYWNFSIFLILILLQYFSDWILVLILQYFKSILNTSTFILYWSMLWTMDIGSGEKILAVICIAPQYTLITYILLGSMVFSYFLIRVVFTCNKIKHNLP